MPIRRPWPRSPVRRPVRSCCSSAPRRMVGGGDACRCRARCGAVEMITQLWRWAQVEGPQPFSISAALRLDPLAATMLTIITTVWPASWRSIPSATCATIRAIPRFFACVAAFVFRWRCSWRRATSPGLRVLGGGGACSYLLIGFWFRKPEAARAAKKAFLVNRVGDFGLAVATFLLWLDRRQRSISTTRSADGAILPGILGQTRLADAAGHRGRHRGHGRRSACFCSWRPAGKSGQLPLHVWLPGRGWKGPTPASSLYPCGHDGHAPASIAWPRSAPLFTACPGALHDRLHRRGHDGPRGGAHRHRAERSRAAAAYSTISQLGYMFASLGTGTLLGFTAAIFHLLDPRLLQGPALHRRRLRDGIPMGGVIDMRRFGGLRRIMPITAATFLVGALALAGVAPFARLPQ